MKIALCLHGYFNNRADSQSGIKGFQYIHQTILKYPVDVFIHSWDVVVQNKIRELYYPLKTQFEPQKDFKEELAKIDQNYIDQGFNREKTLYKNATPLNTLSFSYSRKRAIELKAEYEKENNFKYDCVITARFDLGQRSKARNGFRSVSEIDFNPLYDMNYLYCASFDQLNAGYPDQHFYSNSPNMDLLATFYDKIIDYLQPNSEYERILTSGWPDSNFFENDSTTDPRQFTNEVLKPKEVRSKNLMKYPRWQMINNHIFYKFYCWKIGLYEKTRFI